MNLRKSYKIHIFLATLVILALAFSACSTQQNEDLAGTGGGGLTITDADGAPPHTPIVVSITRADQDPTIAQQVSFHVTFSYIVTGVDVTDFQITSTQAPTDASVLNVSTTDNITYTVSIDRGTISGSDNVGLNLIDDNTIKTEEGVFLGGENLNDGDFTGGEKYTVLVSTPIP